MQKITKKNSIFFNQLWINKAIEDGNTFLLISNRISDFSIGEVIEKRYLSNDLEPNGKKITENNSILYTIEWEKKFLDEGLKEYIPTRRITTGYSLGQILAIKYYEITLFNKQSELESAKVLRLKGEHK